MNQRVALHTISVPEGVGDDIQAQLATNHWGTENTASPNPAHHGGCACYHNNTLAPRLQSDATSATTRTSIFTIGSQKLSDCQNGGSARARAAHAAGARVAADSTVRRLGLRGPGVGNREMRSSVIALCVGARRMARMPRPNNDRRPARAPKRPKAGP